MKIWMRAAIALMIGMLLMVQAVAEDQFPQGVITLQETDDLRQSAIVLPDGALFVAGRSDYRAIMLEKFGADYQRMETHTDYALSPPMHAYAATYNADGTLRWKTVLSINEGWNDAKVLGIDPEGNVLVSNTQVGTGERACYAFDAEGIAQYVPELTEALMRGALIYPFADGILIAEHDGQAKGSGQPMLTWQNADHEVIWCKTLDAPELMHAVFREVIRWQDGFCVALGIASNGMPRGALLWLDPEGTVLKANDALVSDMIALPDQRVVAVEMNTVGGEINCFDPEGSLLWTRFFHEQSFGAEKYADAMAKAGLTPLYDYRIARAYWIAPYADGYVVSGTYYNEQNKTDGQQPYWLIRFSEDGELMGFLELDYMRGLQGPLRLLDHPTAGTYVKGTRYGNEQDNNEFFLIKLVPEIFMDMEAYVALEREDSPRVNHKQ